MQRPHAAGAVLQALEPLAQKIAELELQALEGKATNIVSMMGELAKSLAAAGREAVELVLDQAARAPQRCICTKCNMEASSHGFEATSFIGRFGLIKVTMRRMRCATCRRSWLPLDEAWALPEGGYADDVREATERLACRMPFREAVEELEHLWLVAPDPSTAKRWILRDGDRADQAAVADAQEQWREHERKTQAVASGEERSQERTAGFGVVEVDGVMVLAWKPGQEPRRKTQGEKQAGENEPTTLKPAASDVDAEGRAANHQPPSTLSQVQGSPMGPIGRSPRVHGREICMGITYLDEHVCEESPGRGLLLERRYVGSLNDRDGFWLKLHDAAAAQGVLSKQHVVRVSDGGAYFIDHSAELFSDQPLVGILDIQHAKQHVWETGHKLTADKDETRAWVSPHTEAIRNGHVGAVIIDLAKERERRTGTKQKEAIAQLHGYLDRHKTLMDYPRYKAAGYPLASAAIESTNKRLAGRRLKQGGMIWSEPGVEAMLASRVAFYNPGTWTRLWPHLKLIFDSLAGARRGNGEKHEWFRGGR